MGYYQPTDRELAEWASGDEMDQPSADSLRAAQEIANCDDATPNEAIGRCYSIPPCRLHAAIALALDAAIRETRDSMHPPAALVISEVLEAHRRFHAKVGCPGLPECYVCVAEAQPISRAGRE